MRVVVLGAGYAGLTLARRLECDLPRDADLVVVDETGEHLLQHELHRVVRRPDVAADLSIPLGELLERASVREGRVVEVDRAERAVGLADGEELSYDVAAVCLGAQTDYHGLPGVEAHARPLKGLADAAAVRREFEELLATGGTAVVVGGGLTGVQVAGELAAYAREERADVRVVLLEREDSVAPAFPPAFRTALTRELVTGGVDVRTGTRVTEATADAVRTTAGEVPYDQFVWTGGIRGPDALGGERADVDESFRVDERTFVLGDAARVVDAEGRAVPATVRTAVRSAEAVGERIVQLVGGDADADPSPVARPSGWLVSVGDGAVAKVGPEVFSGAAARALQSYVGPRYGATAEAVRDTVARLREEFRTTGGSDTWHPYRPEVTDPEAGE